MAVAQAGMKHKPLEEMDKDELQATCKKLEVEFLTNDTKPTLVEKIRESGKWVQAKEKGGQRPFLNKETGKMEHPTLGEYIEVIVRPTAAQNNKTSVFASIGLYTVEFQPNEAVKLPKMVAKFLKEAGEAEHYYDAKAQSENGNIGAHCTRRVPKYIVEVVSETLS